MDAQQIKSSEQAAENGASEIAPVEKSQPGNAAGGGFDPARNGGQRRAHQQGWWQQTNGADDGAQQNGRGAHAAVSCVEPGDAWQRKPERDAQDADPQFEERINAKRMAAGRNPTGQKNAAEAHAAHEGPEQDPQRNRRGPDHQLQQLQPDHLVNQRGTAAAHEQQEQQWQESARLRGRWLAGCRFGHDLWLARFMG